MIQCFKISLEIGQTILATSHGDDLPHCEGLAIAKTQEYFGGQIYDCQPYPHAAIATLYPHDTILQEVVE